MAIIHTDPPTIVRGPAVEDFVSKANGENLDIRPPSGEEWHIETIFYGAACTISWCDGTNTIQIDAPTSAGSLDKCEYTVTYDTFIRITNTSGGSAYYGYSGYKLNT